MGWGMATHRFTHVTPHPRDAVWAWFSRPGAMRRLSAPWLPLRPVDDAEGLRDGRASLEVAPFGVRLPLPAWVAQHQPDGFRDGRSFSDAVASEPYRSLTRWGHTHTFESAGDGATRVVDEVTSRVPRRMLEPVFAYRHAQLDADLDAHQRYPGRLTVAVTGASGLIGTQLTALLSTGGHRVIELVRSPRRSPFEARVWDVRSPDPAIFDGVDVVVHLAGAPILGRFDARHKAAIRDSRVGPTRALARAVAAHGGPRALVCASAVGYYGTDRGDEVLTETSGRGAGFLADVVSEWEEASRPASVAGVRVATMRTAGMVLSAAGGALAALRPLFELGAGGRIGDGTQWMSWIALDDLLEVYLRAIVTDLEGAVNAVAPGPLRNAEFTRTLAGALRRPALVPTPSLAPTLLLGREGYAEMLLASHREVPARLEALGHRYRWPALSDALAHELGRPTS